MAGNYETIPTLLVYGEQELGVVAGGGVMGYGGVFIHEPMETDFSRISRDVTDDISPKGAGFNYDEVSTITVSGILVWTNSFLERAPEGRQDVKEKGIVRVELFDKDTTRRRLDDYEGLFDRLGVKIIDCK